MRYFRKSLQHNGLAFKFKVNCRPVCPFPISAHLPNEHQISMCLFFKKRWHSHFYSINTEALLCAVLGSGDRQFSSLVELVYNMRGY